MGAHEIDSRSPIMPSVWFVYSASGEVAGQVIPLVGSAVTAYVNGEITVDEYFRRCEQEEQANRQLRDFMYGDQPPDFMPEVRQVPRWRGWLRDILKTM
ncbi:MAG TPA: hypothetical protein VLH84_02020 [Patescibacteria group bacterium]|nr:hypothetical protein [Patescibacteria group bacterium]